MPKGLARSLARANPAQTAGVKRVTIPLTDTAITITSITTGKGAGGLVASGLPEGNILVLGIGGNVTFTADGTVIGAAADGDFGLGTTPLDDATITGTDVDLIASQAFVAGTAERVASAAALCGTVLDNTDGSLEVNLNVLIDADDIADGSSVDLIANGVIELAIMVLGDD
jgi:hypothetical protein